MNEEREKPDLIERYNALVVRPGGITVKECLTILEENLVNPKTYHMDGNYVYLGKNNYHGGVFMIDKGGNIAGEINDDPNSKVAAHLVLGKITTDENERTQVLSFLKIPAHFLMVPIHYVLRKYDDLPELHGHYEGFWQFTAEGINLKVGWRPGVGKAVLVERPEQQNKASLILSLKT